MFCVILVYFNIQNTLRTSGSFLLGHPVYISWTLICHTKVKAKRCVKCVNKQMNGSCKNSHLGCVLKYDKSTKFTFNKKYAVYFVLSIVFTVHLFPVGRDSSVSIAIRYGLNGPGDRIPVGTRFSAPVQTVPLAYPTSYTMGTGSFPGVKQPDRGVDRPRHLVPKLKNE